MPYFNTVIKDISKVVDAIDYYEKQLQDTREEVALKGNLEKQASSLPGLILYRFTQLQDIEAILEHLNIALSKERAKLLRSYMENYNRQLTVREAEKWIDGEEAVVDLADLINEVAYVRNKYLGVMKGLENKQWQVTNIVKLRVAGLEDTVV